LEVREGEIVALLGRNGVGKTTTLRTIMGALRPASGSIAFRGAGLARATPDRVNRLGISIVPEGRRIFPNLTVLDNLLLAARPGGARLDEVVELFPRLRQLAAARGETLSGGERQMLAIGRALMAPTSLMLLDEPLEGLAPSVVAEVLEAIARLRSRTSILIVEQKVDLTLRLAELAELVGEPGERGRRVAHDRGSGRVLHAGVVDEDLHRRRAEVELRRERARRRPGDEGLLLGVVGEGQVQVGGEVAAALDDLER